MMESMESSCVPPGFRFHPTDEELVGYYLRKKVASQKIDLDVIRDIDLYRIEPWDLQGIGYEEQNEWYFFSHKDKKYPTGTRTNRATIAGFWKATGRDKAVYDKSKLIGMRKTLVFYKGRAPNGQKTDWIMHEYRLESEENGPPQEEGWVVCRAFKKRTTGQAKTVHETWDTSYFYDEPPTATTNNTTVNTTTATVVDHHPINIDYITRHHHHQPPPPPPNFLHQRRQNTNFLCKQEIESSENIINSFINSSSDPFGQLPTIRKSVNALSKTTEFNIFDIGFVSEEEDGHLGGGSGSSSSSSKTAVTTDWRALDKFVASQLSHGDGVGVGGVDDSTEMGMLLMQSGREEHEGNKFMSELFLSSNSDCDIGICVFDHK